MGFLDFFKEKKTFNKSSTWQELGTYRSIFNSVSADPYSSAIVRSCIRPLADFTSKSSAKSSDERIANILNNAPNMYMSGSAFLKKVRTRYEAYNNCFIYIQRDGNVTGFYPVPYSRFDAIESAGRLFVKFYFQNSTVEPIVIPWEDLAVIRKDYNKSDIAGDDNNAILETLELISTTNQGISNAVKATANLRGILKSTKAMLSDDDIKKQKDRFVNDYLTLENKGGIASLDASQEFTPIKMEPTVANAEQMKEFREDVYRYYGVNDSIVMSNMNSDQIEAFYELKIEPFLVELSSALTSKVFTERQKGFKAYIIYEANKLQFASLEKKIQIFSTVVLYGGMTINEWRQACNMAPVEGGDEMIRRLDADTVKEVQNEDGKDE